MVAGVLITREEMSSSDLRHAAARCSDGRVACRMLAIAHVLEGKSRTEAAQSCGMDRQTLRDWVHRYNQAGLAGLSNLSGAGRPAALTPEQMAELRVVVLAGPDPGTQGLVRWRCTDLQGIIAERFAVSVHERTVGKLLRRLGLSRLKPRPHNPKRDEAAQEAFKKTSPPWSQTLLRPQPPASRSRSGSRTKPEWGSKGR
jgi:transposase